MARRKEPVVYKSAFNEYTVIGDLGHGGSGTVYEVRDVESRHYALKAIDPARSTFERLKRFKNETIFCQGNRHKNIITVLDHGRGPLGEPFYVMEVYPLTLHRVMTGGLAHSEILPIFSQLLDGVEAAHLKGVIHRDLKPQNILCDSQKNAFVIADFGIAAFEEEDLYTAVETRQAERLANFQYAAPEQRARGRVISSKADIFALGLILNEMFTAEIPQGTGFKTIGSVSPDYSYLDAIVDYMMRNGIEERPTVAEVKQQLLARKQEFVSLQKIDRLSGEVVPEITVDDPLIRNPITIKNVDYQPSDSQSGQLLFTLSQGPNPKWQNEFHQQPTTHFLGYPPGGVRFQGALATMNATRPNAAQQVEHFKRWLTSANGLYAGRMARESEERRQNERNRLQRELAAEKERQEVLRQIKL